MSGDFDAKLDGTPLSDNLHFFPQLTMERMRLVASWMVGDWDITTYMASSNSALYRAMPPALGKTVPSNTTTMNASSGTPSH